MVRFNGRRVAIAGLWVLLFAGFGTVEAASLPISEMCPGSGVTATNREYTLTATTEIAPLGDAEVDCYAYDTGNLNDNEFAGETPAWILIDKDNEGGVGTCEACFAVSGVNGTSGDFSIAAALWTSYNELLIGFKVGRAQGQDIDPDWAAFLLAGGITGGTWGVSHDNGLSHATLWGRFNPDRDLQVVPEPASLLLLGSGLLVAARRRRAAR